MGNDAYQWYGLIGLMMGFASLPLWLYSLSKWHQRLQNRQDTLEDAWIDFQEKRELLYKRLADPDVIAAEMEHAAWKTAWHEATEAERVEMIAQHTGKAPATIHTAMPGTGTLKPGGVRRKEG